VKASSSLHMGAALFAKDPFALLEGSEVARNDPGLLGPEVLVDFEVRRLKGARLLWLNTRWFLEDGIDVTNPKTHAQVADWLTATYGVVSTASRPSGGSCGWLQADRYGGTDGAIHGGSGRCGGSGRFHGKGVGRTPLVSEQSDEQHKSGFLTLKESVREVVGSELCRAELAHGAVPVIAILDAGFSFRPTPEAELEPAVIVVRPNFIRPAHLERSIFFGTSGTRSSDQYLDAQRVKSAVRAFTACGSGFPAIGEMFGRLAEQIGCSRALRLWQGRFLSSNVTVEGALVDFGAFRSVPNWSRCHGLAGEYFGGELGQLKRAFLSVAYYATKYADETSRPLEVRQTLNVLEHVERCAFTRASLDALGVTPNSRGADGLSDLILEYFEQQQREVTGDGLGGRAMEAYTILEGGTEKLDSPARAADIALVIIRALRRLHGANENLAMSRARAFFEPRRVLNWAASERTLASAGRALKSATPGDGLSRIINRQIAASRRYWQHVPGEELLGHVTDASSSLLYTRDLGSGKVRALATGPLHGDRMYVLGKWRKVDSLDPSGRAQIDLESARQCWSFGRGGKFRHRLFMRKCDGRVATAGRMVS
jgi:hypothetical protein